jgi:hypothetical protein
MLGMPAALMSMTMMAAVPAIAAGEDPLIVTGAVPLAKTEAALRVSHVRHDVVTGGRILVKGRLVPAGARRAISLQVSRSGRGWTTVDHDRTDARGRYRLTWRARRTGTRQVRVHFGGTAELTSTRRQVGPARIYRRASASWYGPGLYGQHLACGGILTPATLGVASKTLPCGTRITLRYRGRKVRVPVVDRGPYIAGRELDLTAATKARLRFGSTGLVMTTA